MRLLKIVWALCPIGHAVTDGQQRLHPHRVSSYEEDAREAYISASGQPVVRREAKQEDEDRQDDQMPIELHRQQQVVTQLAPKALVATGEPLPVKVDGCQDAATAHVIEGSYMPAGTSGDKPSYKKDGSGTGDDEVWLYHYADLDAGSVGWWIGSNPSGRVHIYAFNPSEADLPPSNGWKAPWWGDVDASLQIETLEQDLVTQLPEVAKEDEPFTATSPPVDEPFAATTTEGPNDSDKGPGNEAPAVSNISKDMEPSEMQHLLKEEGEMITAAVAKLSSGKKLADMVFGTDTAAIPDEPPSDEMLEKLSQDPAMAKKALNRTVSILQGAVSRLESGEAFANELLGTDTRKWLEATEEVVSMAPISKHAEEVTTTTADEPPVEGSKAAPLLKSVDEVAVAATDAAEKARLWKDAEIAQLHAKQAAEEAKKKVEKLTVQAAKEEAEKAIEEAAGGEAAEAKEEASKLAAKADAEVADKETEVAKAKKKLASLKNGTAEKDAAEKELKEAEDAVKKATVKAEVLEKKAGNIKLAKQKDSDDNALYSQEGEAGESGPIVMGSEPKSDGEKVLEDKLDILQTKLQGLERVQMKDKLEDQLSASLTEVDGGRLLSSAPKDVAEPKGEATEGEEKEKKPKKKSKGSWNRVTIFVMVAMAVVVLAFGAVYQLVTIRRLSKQAKADEKQPLMQEEDNAANPAAGAEVHEDPVPAGS